MVKKPDGTVALLSEAAVDFRPLQGWMSVYSVRSDSGTVPAPAATLEDGWADIPADAKKVLVLVHGYHVTDPEATSKDFPAFFKRLYWAGQDAILPQGGAQVVGISWPGDVSFPYWPDDEFNALESGVPLAAFFRQEAAAGRGISVFAHSLGNMVVNSAINRLIQAGDAGDVGATATLGAITSFVSALFAGRLQGA